MIVRHHIPGPPLAGLVEMIWYYDDCPPAAHAYDRILPNGAMGLVINLAEDETRVYDERDLATPIRNAGGVVCGAFSRYFVIDTTEQRSVMGVSFHPGGAIAFLGLPADALRDQHVALEDVLGIRARHLRERVLTARTPEARIAIVEQELIALLARARARHPAIGYALRQMMMTSGTTRIDAVRQETGYSAKRFIELFRAEVGLSPKRWSRLRRFQSALRQYTAGVDVSWSRVALDCGYYDQAHFVNDFRAFSGVTPSRYAPSVPGYVNHVALTD
jgi:AraC-like DNA-binding protein